MRMTWIGVLIGSFVVLSLAWLAPRVDSEEVTPVLVTNLPELQRIEGEVEVPSAIPHARSVRLSKVVVPPSLRSDPGDLVPAGVLDAAGFTEVVLSLHGILSEDVFQSGEVGALLIPEDREILRAWREDALALFPLEVSTIAESGAIRFHAQQVGRVAFPQYDILMFNETNRSVEVDLHVYLTN